MVKSNLRTTDGTPIDWGVDSGPGGVKNAPSFLTQKEREAWTLWNSLFAAKLEHLEAQSLKRTLSETDRFAAALTRRDGKEMISFCCNDYLNLSHDRRVIDAANEATQRYGAGSGASRLVTGNHPLYETLETKLAAYKETEAAVVFGSGYLTNVGVHSNAHRGPTT